MRAWAKLLLGAAAFAPIATAAGLGAYLALRLIAFDVESGGTLPINPFEASEQGPFDASDLLLLAVVAVSVALFGLGLAAVFAAHAARDPRLSGTRVLLWSATFLLAGPLALPLYFLLYVLRDPIPKVKLPDIP